ncbi:MAG TPA: dihydrodipicolinate synthase family protein [Candidatus Acidoferrales bacterium]|nr:dihydrodipicolinate synthase family protein [Candidatus Acidoferrales bacterium]
MKLHGIFPPLTTPFSNDGEVDLPGFRANIERYNQTRLSGYVMNGSTSESVLLSWNEVESLWAAAREFAAANKEMVAGTGAESTAETIQHTKRAAKLGYDAALVRTPSYYKPFMTFEAEATHFLRVADASPIPILIYSVPVFTGYTVEAPLVARLSSHANIVGIKDSSGNVQRMKDIIASTPKNFCSMTGSALTLHDALQAGACGAILAISCVFPDACVDLYQAAAQNDIARVEQLKKHAVLPAANLATKFGIPGLKYAMDRLGYRGGPPRAPLLPLGESAKHEIDTILTTVKPATASAH